jgi:hypothetical protein
MIANATYTRFIDYLKYLCEQHNVLQHTDSDGNKIFFVTNVERVTAFTVDEIRPQSYCVVCMYPDAQKSNQRGIMTNTFMLFIGHWSNTTEDAAAIHSAMSASYALLLSLLSRLHVEEEEGRVFLGTGSSLTIGGASPVENYYPNYSGWLLRIDTSHKYAMQQGIDTWADGGITPPVL